MTPSIPNSTKTTPSQPVGDWTLALVVVATVAIAGVAMT